MNGTSEIMMEDREFKVGFCVNPIAGMGGSVGLKGTDGREILEKAIERGAEPRAGERAMAFLKALVPIISRITFLVPEGDMGARWLRELDDERVAQEIMLASIPERTTREDTISFVRAVVEEVDIIVFVGGDGTARDVLEGLQGFQESNIPVIGVPA
ncbi:hypothetical protein GF325_06160, partial [Candidatus Bathyarchaeota archaeon]|nr:hypothetical protein [Candidatus Bathyarchaeota archaeon]